MPLSRPELLYTFLQITRLTNRYGALLGARSGGRLGVIWNPIADGRRVFWLSCNFYHLGVGIGNAINEGLGCLYDHDV